MEKWPRIEDVAKATLGEVIIQWQGLGYNRRARFLWLLAKEIGENRKCIWPKEEKELLKLPVVFAKDA
jgi:A/G-specific adenine glycosylase